MTDSAIPVAPRQRRKVDPRDQLMKFRVTLAEAAQIQARASQVGMTLSDFMRQAAHGAPIRRVRDRALDATTLHHLALLGSNMNQIARVLNTTGEPERAADLDELVLEVRALLASVRDRVR